MSLYDTINQINNNTSLMNFARGQSKLGKNDMDSADFMQLMLAQLKYQDPMKPMDNSQFMAQQAQMTQVQKINELVDFMQGNAQLTQASGIVGKRVSVKGTDGVTVTGTVDSVTLANGEAGLNINGVSYKMGQVTKIFGS